MKRKITPYFILAIVAICIVYDFWIIEEQGKPESISATIIRWAHDFPSIPFATGFLCGHLFWRLKEKDLKAPDQES